MKKTVFLAIVLLVFVSNVFSQELPAITKLKRNLSGLLSACAMSPIMNENACSEKKGTIIAMFYSNGITHTEFTYAVSDACYVICMKPSMLSKYLKVLEETN